MEWGSIIVSVIGGGTLAAIITAIANRRKARADTASVLNDAAIKQINSLLVRVDKLEKDLESRDKEIVLLRAQLEAFKQLLIEKDTRIDELTELTSKQEGRIEELEAEVIKLRYSRDDRE